jgi:hypothetical protein
VSARFPLFAVLCAGCFYQDVTAPRPTAPGGLVSAQLDGGTKRGTLALAHWKMDPLLIDGASTELTFSVTAGDDASGQDPKALLGVAGGKSDLLLSPTSRNHLEIHAGGSGCVATSGVVHLRADATLKIEGEFDGQGGGPGDLGTSCAIAGSLAGVPVDR